MTIPTRFGHFINGEFVEPDSGSYIDSINPADESVVTGVANGNQADVEKAVTAAKSAYREWANMRPLERGQILDNLGRIIQENLDELCKVESMEMGAPVDMLAVSMQGAARYFRYYGGLAPTLNGDHIQVGPNQHSYTMYEPYGVVGVITPWNAPLNQTARSVAPALAAGNAVVHKPSEFTSATALMTAELAVQAGLPKGIWNIVTGYGTDVGGPLVAHQDVKKVAFTGSVMTGQAIAHQAADKIMPVTLELGGKSPDIIFEDADLPSALQGAVLGFVANSGQICLAGTRVLVQRSIYDKVCEMMAGAVGSLPLGVGNPMPTLGPLANKQQLEKVLGYFEVAKQEGAKLLTGGERANEGELSSGYYVRPTVYADVDNRMRIAQEEIFGPVGVVIPFDTEEEAIAIANDTEYGLAAGVWTQNLGRAHRVAQQIEAGQIYVNAYFEGSVEHPLGGHKKSGIGYEKGEVALRHYAQLKNIVMNIAP